MGISDFNRATSLARLATEEFDVLIVGGGITGVGCALDAASRGLRTALVERDDFASGTSSKSSKLIHGGIRYLQQREYKLVYESLLERQIALRNAPHLVRVLPFLIPILSKDGLINRKIARALGAAMWMYDLTGGLRIRKAHKRINRGEALAHMPELRSKNVSSAYIYYDGEADDARLTLAIARTAAANGAVVANGASVTELIGGGETPVSGARVKADGQVFDVRARIIINATGVWADEIRTLDEHTDPNSIRPAKGIHITVPWGKVRNDIAVVLPVAKDRRSIFVVPWGNTTYIGTTDTDYEDGVEEPQCTDQDVEYLLTAINAAIKEPLTKDDVIGTWAGLRPLLRQADSERTADLSRRHGIRVSASGVITITGGKLTTYRRMASDTIDAASRELNQKTKCRTKNLPLIGADGFKPSMSSHNGSTDPEFHLTSRYGSESKKIKDLVAGDPRLGKPLVTGLPYLRAEAIFAVRYEMAQDIDDVLDRRTRARLLARDATSAAAIDVGNLIGPELGWDEAEITRRVCAYQESITAEREAAHLPETLLPSELA